jgi:hypothetical protein
MTQRIVIEKGKLINFVSVSRILGFFDECPDDEYWLEFQVYELNGSPAKGSYRGPGVLIKEQGRSTLLLGDPARQANLAEYRVDEQPTADSERRLDEFAAGFRAGATEGKRRKTNASEEWRDGYERGLRCRHRRF